jgi:nucleoside-diphosphate-sugar epimerase
MKRTLITGGTGFIGANLARRLVREGHEVHLLVRPGHQAWRLEGLHARVQLQEVSLLDRDALGGLARALRPEWIFHLAAHGAYSWQTNLTEMVRTNLQGTMNLLDACLPAGFAAFVHAGSSSEYGWKDHAPAETELPEPNSPYAVTKLAATNYCRLIARRERAPVTTLRLYSAYGPYEDPHRLLPQLALRGLKGGLPPLVAPDTARDYVWVGDVVEAFLLAARRAVGGAGAWYNVGTGRQTTLAELVELARRILAIDEKPRWGSMPARSWDTGCWVADVRLIQSELGWVPQHDLERGFQEMVKWLTDNPALAAHYEANAR